jgi:outer membrane protein assembly factor BamB
MVQAFYVIYAAIAGDTGTPIHPPAFLPGPGHFGKWIAYISPTVADLDGDGTPEVYLNSASYARGGYAAVRIDGRPLWVEFHDNAEGSDGFGPVGDFDGDGKPEIAVPVLNGTLVCLNAADGKRKWTINTPVTGDVVAADVNGDGMLELVFAGRDGRMRAMSGKDGREIWSIAAGGRPVIADVDGDGQVEILAIGADGVLRIIGPA